MRKTTYLRAENRVVANLSAGEHIVAVHLREDGTRLDRIELQKVAQWPQMLAGYASRKV